MEVDLPVANARRQPRWHVLGLLAALYFVQGLPFGFQATALPVFLREAGVSLTGIGLLGLLALPWALKALWAPLVDAAQPGRLGRRRKWILGAQLGLLVCCVAAAALRPEDQLSALLAAVFVMNLCAATQDIAVDGLAVDVLGTADLGPANAAQVVGYKAGMLTGGGLLVWASATTGWSGLFVAMAALVGVVWVWVWVAPIREPAMRTPARPVAAVARGLWRALRAGGWGVVAIVATYKTGETLVDVMFKPFLVDAGFAAADIGLWVGTWGMGASMLGSLAGGWLATRLSLSRALLLTAALRVGPMLGEWWLASGSPTASGVIAVTVAEHLAGGALTTVMFAWMMAHTDRRVGASHYTLLAAVEVLGKSPAAWISGPIAERAGYALTFGVGVALALGFLALLWGVDRRALAGRPAPTEVG